MEWKLTSFKPKGEARVRSAGSEERANDRKQSEERHHSVETEQTKRGPKQKTEKGRWGVGVSWVQKLDGEQRLTNQGFAPWDVCSISSAQANDW